MSDNIKNSLTKAMKDAMRARDKQQLGAIRMILAEFKRIEVDERIAIADDRALTILDKMVKQRRDAAKQYEDAGRQELAGQEYLEINVIQEFLPKQLSQEEILDLIDTAIAETGASGMQDMGKLMGLLKPRLQGRADMGAVSGLIKTKLA